jgi:hypothetical protein
LYSSVKLRRVEPITAYSRPIGRQSTLCPPWPDLKSLKKATFDWIENYYNRQRRHSTLGYLTPQENELGYRDINQNRGLMLVHKGGNSPVLAAEVRLVPYLLSASDRVVVLHDPTLALLRRVEPDADLAVEVAVLLGEDQRPSREERGNRGNGEQLETSSTASYRASRGRRGGVGGGRTSHEHETDGC